MKKRCVVTLTFEVDVEAESADEAIALQRHALRRFGHIPFACIEAIGPGGPVCAFVHDRAGPQGHAVSIHLSFSPHVVHRNGYDPPGIDMPAGGGGGDGAPATSFVHPAPKGEPRGQDTD